MTAHNITKSLPRTLRTAAVIALIAVTTACITRTVRAEPPARVSQATEFTVSLTPDEVWKSFATESGVQLWNGEKASLDLAQGGEVRLAIGEDAEYVGSVVAFEPGRALIFAPAMGMSEGDAVDNAPSWTAIEIHPDANADDVTRVSILSRIEREGPVPPTVGTALRRVASEFVGAASARRPTLSEQLAELPAPAEVETNAHSLELPIPPAEAWKYFATEDGIRAWMVPNVRVDMRTGGTVQSRYDGGEIGEPGTIVQRLLVVDAPNFYVAQVKPDPAVRPSLIGDRVWSFIRFDANGEGGTVVTLNGINWGDDELSREMKAFFDRGNPMLLEALRRHVGGDERSEDDARLLSDEAETAVRERMEAKPDDADEMESAPTAEERDRMFATLLRFVGGEWIHDGTAPNGQPFLVRNVYELGPGGRSLTAKGWLGSTPGMFYHGATQCWIEPGTNEVRFQNINERGAVARGTMRSPEENVILWDWRETGTDGTTNTYDIRIELTGEDSYRFQLSFVPEVGEARPMVDIEYQRMAAEDVPAKFHQLMQMPAR